MKNCGMPAPFGAMPGVRARGLIGVDRAARWGRFGALRLALAALGGLSLACPMAGQAQTWNAPEDGFVQRGGPEDRPAQARGALGIVLPSHGRMSLYEAWRVLSVPLPALSAGLAEAAKRAEQVPAPPAGQPIAEWRRARELAGVPALAGPLDYYKSLGEGRVGQFGNCSPSAFRLARQVLEGLRADPAVPPAEVRRWVEGQDAVFARCGDVVGPLPALPALLPAAAPRRLQGLREYQRAAALFYGGDFHGAQAAFEAIEASDGHPMQAWAALAALRCRLRLVTLDPEWGRAFTQAWEFQGLRGAALTAALAEPQARMQARNASAAREIEARAERLLAQERWAPIHADLRGLVLRELEQLDPVRLLELWMTQLDRLPVGPLADELLERWAGLYRRTLPDLPGGALGRQLRLHTFFDWTQSLQACDDAPAALAADGGRCAAAHAHALARWRETREMRWLVASLVSLRVPEPGGAGNGAGGVSTLGAEDLAALDAARQTPLDSVAGPTLHFHAARSLRRLGRPDEARGLVERLLARPGLDRSATNLLRQEQFALATSPAQALQAVLRLKGGGGVAVAADGGQWLDQRASARQLLALAEAPGTPPALADELAVVAWMRADLLQQRPLARQAAAVAGRRLPRLSALAQAYQGADGMAAARDVLVPALLELQMSPQMSPDRRHQSGAPRPRFQNPGGDWCSFEPSWLAERASAQRAPGLSPALQRTWPESTELPALRALGSGSTWWAREAIAVVQRHPVMPGGARLLKSAEAILGDEACPVADAPSLEAEIGRLRPQAR